MILLLIDISDPNCVVAHLMKTLHQDEEFLSKVKFYIVKIKCFNLGNFCLRNC